MTWKDEEISFGLGNMEGIHAPYDDAIVIIATMYNHVVKTILFDNGSASDVLYYDAMKNLGISDDQLKPLPTPPIGFENEEVEVQEVISLPLTLGEEPKATIVIVDFMVVNAP